MANKLAAASLFMVYQALRAVGGLLSPLLDDLIILTRHSIFYSSAFILHIDIKYLVLEDNS
jgi:hypothetical protein